MCVSQPEFLLCILLSVSVTIHCLLVVCLYASCMTTGLSVHSALHFLCRNLRYISLISSSIAEHFLWFTYRRV